MMQKIFKIYFVHDGKAFYSSVQAAKELFKDDFQMEEVTYEELKIRKDTTTSICWYVMGFYPKALPAVATIHDYLSLSVGRFAKFKDLLKFYFNAKPDLRLIQTSIRDFLPFKDNIPTVYLDIGIPSLINDVRNAKAKKKYDFCYFGVISHERKLPQIISSFLKHYGSSKTFILVGSPEESVVEEFKSHPNVIFTGGKKQAELFEIIQQSRVAVCYFPEHFPHIYQTPTKLIEAAALKARILANPQRMNTLKADEYNIHAHWNDWHDLFAGLPANLDWDDNADIDHKPMLWAHILKKAGFLKYLEQMSNRKLKI